MTEFKAFRGQQDGKIVQSTGKVPELGQHDVLIKLTHAGLCFTDVRTCEILLNGTSDTINRLRSSWYCSRPRTSRKGHQGWY